MSAHSAARADQLVLASWLTAAAAFSLCTPPFEGLADAVFMAGPFVVGSVGYMLALLLAGAAAALAVAAAVMRARARSVVRSAGGGAVKPSATYSPADPAAPHVPADSAAEGWGRRIVRWTANCLMACALAMTFAIAGFWCLLGVSYVADPPSSAGDRVVVVERNVLLSGNGTVYVVPRGFGFGREVASYFADDGYSPMGNGTYTLEWNGREPDFEAYGNPVDPVGMYPAGSPD